MDHIDPPALDALVARLAEGDRSGFPTIFRALWPPILRLCQSLLKNEADALDAAQEAMEKVFTRSSDYDPQRAALPWALAIAAWECRTTLRKRQRRREAPPVEEEGLSELGVSAGETEEQFAQRDLVRAALDALGNLPELDRETLTATFWEEAATTSGATLRKRRERGLERLRTSFRRLYGF